MVFEGIPGNDQIKSYLKHMLEKQRIGNSLLFAGPKGSHKELFASELAKLLVGCSKEDVHHPDIHIYHPEGKIAMHSIDTMRKFCEEVYIAPYSSTWKVFIIHEAERMLPYSANALLKTFEEPAKDSVIILISDDPSNLLPTVLSRCRRINFLPMDREKPQLTEIETSLLTFLKKGKVKSFEQFKQAVNDISSQAEKLKDAFEENARKELYPDNKENLTAFQKESIEKEIDGLVSMQYHVEINRLFHIILGWFRDLHLLKVGGNPQLLLYSLTQVHLDEALLNHQLIPIPEVEKIILEAQLAVDRFTPLPSVLETLFLKLNWL